MPQFKKILVPFDDNVRSIRALEYAAMFASGIGASITALHLADPESYQSKEAFQKDLNQLVEDQLRPKLVEIQKKYPDIVKIDLQIRGLQKSVYRHIITFAQENQIDFLVMRNHGLPQGGDWELHFKNTTAYNVVLEAPCPVFTFTHLPQNPKMKNILVPLDLSDGSLYKIPIAIDLAKQFNATLHLISGSESVEEHPELKQQIEEIYQSLQTMGLNMVKSDVFKDTLPGAIETYAANSDVDLVVIMSRPGFRWSDLWVSSKAKQIISRSPVPVFSIRAEGPLETGL